VGLPGLAIAAEAPAAAALAPGLRVALREAAVQAGEVIWERGVILKGNGLCHGISGNGYAFLGLHRLTGDIEQLRRAEAFAALIGNESVQEAITQQPDDQREVNGVPDTPRSLMEGSAGVFCFLLDAACPARSAFPAWEF